MSTTIRKIALAVASAAMSLGVQAAPTLLDFNDQISAPTKLGELSGLRFTGATAYLGSMLNVEEGAKPTVASNEGIAMNRAPDLTPNSGNPNTSDGVPGAVSDLEISLTVKNTYFTSMTFDYGVSGVVRFILWSGNSATTPIELTGSGAGMAWNPIEDLSKYFVGTRVNRIEFESANSSPFALDNLRFDTGTTGTPPTVPEPASYALVALALLAAGGASRRCKA